MQSKRWRLQVEDGRENKSWMGKLRDVQEKKQKGSQRWKREIKIKQRQ